MSIDTQGSEEDIRCPRPRVGDVYEVPCASWQLIGSFAKAATALNH